jgi:hypothetical protein
MFDMLYRQCEVMVSESDARTRPETKWRLGHYRGVSHPWSTRVRTYAQRSVCERNEIEVKVPSITSPSCQRGAKLVPLKIVITEKVESESQLSQIVGGNQEDDDR